MNDLNIPPTAKTNPPPADKADKQTKNHRALVFLVVKVIVFALVPLVAAGVAVYVML